MAADNVDYEGVASAVDFDDLGNVHPPMVLKGYRDGVPVVLAE